MLAEFLRASAAVLAGLLVMWTAADILLHVDEIAGQVARGMREVALRAYPVLPIAVPIACVAGAVLCLTRASRNRELTAIQTGGIRLQLALVPILVACALAAIGLGVLEDRVLVPARSALELRHMAESGDEVRAPERLLGRWWFASPSSIFSAGAYDAKQHVLRDVTVFLFDEQRAIRERIDAKSAANLDGDTWEIREANVLEFRPRWNRAQERRRRCGSTSASRAARWIAPRARRRGPRCTSSRARSAAAPGMPPSAPSSSSPFTVGSRSPSRC
jgi:lipopolysaccharide export LptBFGC system permease protein LptF